MVPMNNRDLRANTTRFSNRRQHWATRFDAVLLANASQLHSSTLVAICSDNKLKPRINACSSRSRQLHLTQSSKWFNAVLLLRLHHLATREVGNYVFKLLTVRETPFCFYRGRSRFSTRVAVCSAKSAGSCKQRTVPTALQYFAASA